MKNKPLTPQPSVDLKDPENSSSPHLPHERDQEVGTTDGVPSERVRQGARDLKRGLRDTTRADEAGVAYEKQKK